MGSAGSSAAPLTLCPSPGLLQAPPAHPALLWHQGELWVLSLVGAGSLGRLKHRDQPRVGSDQCGTSPEWSSPTDQPHSPTCAPSWGFSQALIFPLLEPSQGCQRRREELSLLGKKQSLGLAWECEGPRRLLSPGLTPRPGPCTLPYLPQQDQGLCPGWAALVPLSCSGALLAWGALPSVLGTGPRVPHASAPAVMALTRLWDRTAVWWVLTTQTQGFPLPFLVFLAVSLDLHPGAAAG